MVLTHIIVLHLTSENRIEYADVYNVQYSVHILSCTSICTLFTKKPGL